MRISKHDISIDGSKNIANTIIAIDIKVLKTKRYKNNLLTISINISLEEYFIVNIQPNSNKIPIRFNLINFPNVSNSKVLIWPFFKNITFKNAIYNILKLKNAKLTFTFILATYLITIVPQKEKKL